MSEKEDDDKDPTDDAESVSNTEDAKEATEYRLEEKISEGISKWAKNQIRRYKIINKAIQEHEDEYEYRETLMQDAEILKKEATQPLHYYLEENIEEYGKQGNGTNGKEGITPGQKDYLKDLLEGNIDNQQEFMSMTKKMSVLDKDMKGKDTKLSDIIKILTKKQASKIITRLEDK